MFGGTSNAVGNVPRVYDDRAGNRRSGSHGGFRFVLLPAIVPELRASVLLNLGLSWSLVVAGELLGAQEGLGVTVTSALQFAYTRRVMIIVFMFVIYAAIAFALMQATRRIVIWQR